MKKKYLKTLLLLNSMLLFNFVVFTQTNNKSGLKPVTSPLQKDSPKITVVERPISKKTVTFSKVPSSLNTGVRGTEIIGEGRYLNFDKEIINRSVTGEIPSDFPKHIIGQSKADYIIVMNEWVKNNPSKVKPKSFYLEYDALIKSMTIDGKIPADFPKHSNNQTRQQYLQVMKNWAKQNISLIKPEYLSTINK